jgi:hypothetical protein
MCFAPQRRARFEHFNFQKWSEHVVFLHVFAFWVSKFASRVNGVQFFIPHSARTALASLLFAPPGPQHRKNIVFCDFFTFSRA